MFGFNFSFFKLVLLFFIVVDVILVFNDFEDEVCEDDAGDNDIESNFAVLADNIGSLKLSLSSLLLLFLSLFKSKTRFDISFVVGSKHDISDLNFSNSFN